MEELTLAETSPSANAIEAAAPAPVQPLRPNVVPWWLVIALFAFLCIGLYQSMTQFTKGKFIYPLDDTYIEMATARNLVLHGTWGVTRHEFTSSASSPLYIVLLAAGYLIAGPNEWWPLVLASFFGGVSLLVARRVLRGASLPVQITALSGIALLVPLHVMAVIGMEHSLHIALTLLFLHLSAKLIAGDRPVDWMLLAVTAAMVSARYEGLFAAGTVCVILLVWKRKPVESVAVLLAAATPVVVYGLISMSRGSYPIANSLLLKGASFGGGLGLASSAALLHIYRGFDDAPWLVPLAGALIASLVRPRSWQRSYPLAAAIITLCTMVIHLACARVGWVFRYEAYLIAMAIMALGLIAGRGGITRRPVLAALMVAAALGLTVRAVWAMGSLPVWSASIYAQQYQMARFLSEYYQGASVAANDIGAINYFADLRCLDLVGLANIDVMRAKRRGTYSTDFISYEASRHGTEIALVYDSWFARHPVSEFGGPPLPASWVRVARWSVPDFGVLGSDTVSFYAVRPDAREQLRQNLQRFAPTLPRLVTVR